MRKFGSRKSGKKQESRKVVFRPGLERTFRTLDLALVEYPTTTKKDWLIADSELEYKRFCFLLKAFAKGEIEELHFHPEYILLPQTSLPPNSLRKKRTQSKIGYEADSSYIFCGVRVVEDVKASYSNSEKNREKGIAGKPIIEPAARLRHKILTASLVQQFGALAHFKIVTIPEADLTEE